VKTTRVSLGIAACLLVLGAIRARADEPAEKLAEGAWDGIAGKAVQIEQRGEMSARELIESDAEKPSMPLPMPSTMTWSDPALDLTRIVTSGPTGEIDLIRRGKAVAMKIGSGPWGQPSGVYAQVSGSLANPGVCPVRSPDTRREWRFVGAESVDGHDATVLESVGDWPLQAAKTTATAVPEAMRQALGGELELVSYSIRMWVSKEDGHLLQQEKTIVQHLSRPDGLKMEMSQHILQIFRGVGSGVEIEVPPEAEKVLAAAEGSDSH
jgi:hypothetical protein